VVQGKKGRKVKSNKLRLITKYIPKSLISEQYRTLRTNISFSDKDATIRSITVSSPIKGEGKSTISSNLAVVYSQLGKKILIVDADLRKPNQHQIFQLSNSVGLSNVLNKQADLMTAIQETDINGLFVLTSGIQPPYPSELLSSETMDQFLVDVYKLFELVIFDTPPLLAVTDAQLIANNTDASILVIESGSTDIKSANHAIELLSSAKSKFLGAVLNKKSFNKQDIHYHYGSVK
jgi:protein-tyrosine kinase